MLQKTALVRQKAFEKLFDGVCTITVKEEYTRENGSTALRDSVTVTNEPCRLSHASSPVASDNGVVTLANQTVKLFISPTVTIPEGSKVTVTQYGITKTYKRSGMPVVRDAIQSVELEVLDNEC